MKNEICFAENTKHHTHTHTHVRLDDRCGLAFHNPLYYSLILFIYFQIDCNNETIKCYFMGTQLLDEVFIHKIMETSHHQFLKY